jgi:hypothetical protein
MLVAAFARAELYSLVASAFRVCEFIILLWLLPSGGSCAGLDLPAKAGSHEVDLFTVIHKLFRRKLPAGVDLPAEAGSHAVALFTCNTNDLAERTCS